MRDATVAISETVELVADPGTVWEKLSQPSVLATCLPGALITGERADGTLEGELEMSLGPAVARFRGEMTPLFEPAQRRGQLQAVAADRDGRTRARATTAFRIVEGGAGGSVVHLEAEITVAGALAAFMRTGGKHLARKMIVEFADNLAAVCAPSTLAGAAVAALPDSGGAVTTVPDEAPKARGGGVGVFIKRVGSVRHQDRSSE